MKQSELLRKINWEISNLKIFASERAFSPVADVLRYCSRLEEVVNEAIEDGVELEPYEKDGVQYCGCCGQKVSLRRKRIDKAMVSALIRAYNYVMENRVQTFQISQINFTPIEYGILNHLVRFGLLYKSEKMKHGEYGMPRKIVYRFLKNDWSVAEYYETDPTKKEGEDGRRTMSPNRIKVSEIPSIGDLQKEFGEGLTEYICNDDF